MMELSIKDRLLIQSIFQPQGKFAEYMAKKSIISKTEIKEDESKEIGLTQDEESGSIKWDVDKDTPLCVEFDASEKDYLRKCCEAISDNEMSDDIWSLVEKIYDSMD